MQPPLDTSPKVSDEVEATTCYMCACRCGILVHLKDGQVRYIEGNPDHPVNKGVMCGKGAAGIMQHLSPARLRAPLLRTGERGKGEFKEISWDEALALATRWLGEVREKDPKKLAFFTGRDQSQSLTGLWAINYGTPNYAAHGGFCSVNMAAAGLYTFGGSFWEFGEPDWERTEYFLLFGVAEDHASNPIKQALGKLKQRGAKVVAVNPVRTGYGAIADEWIGIKPGTDGLFVSALIHELLARQKIDLDYLARYTNAPWLVVDAPGTAEHGLFARDAAGKALVFDLASAGLAGAPQAGLKPAMTGRRTIARWPHGAARVRADGRALSRSQIRPRGRRARKPAYLPRRSAASPLSSPKPPSPRRSAWPSPGPIGPARRTPRPSAGRSPCTPCAASRPTPTASTPAGSSTSCRSCSGRSIALAASATSRPIPSPCRRH